MGITTRQAADELGIQPSRVRQLVAAGLLTATKFGRDLMIDPTSLAKARRRRTSPGPKPKVISEKNGD